MCLHVHKHMHMHITHPTHLCIPTLLHKSTHRRAYTQHSLTHSPLSTNTHPPTQISLHMLTPFTHTSVYIHTPIHTSLLLLYIHTPIHTSLHTYKYHFSTHVPKYILYIHNTHTYTRSLRYHTDIAHRHNQDGIWTWMKKLGHFIISQFQWGDWEIFFPC